MESNFERTRNFRLRFISWVHAIKCLIFPSASAVTLTNEPTISTPHNTLYTSPQSSAGYPFELRDPDPPTPNWGC
jgi:hypothetical protein